MTQMGLVVMLVMLNNASTDIKGEPVTATTPVWLKKETMDSLVKHQQDCMKELEAARKAYLDEHEEVFIDESSEYDINGFIETSQCPGVSPYREISTEDEEE